MGEFSFKSYLCRKCGTIQTAKKHDCKPMAKSDRIEAAGLLAGSVGVTLQELIDFAVKNRMEANGGGIYGDEQIALTDSVRAIHAHLLSKQ